MSGFRVGDEVVCVDNIGDLGWAGDRPELGKTYQVKALGWFRDEAHVHIRGLFNPALLDGVDRGYRSSRFRPVHRTKTDLSIEAFSTIKPGYEEPKRVERVKKGVGV